MNDLKRDDIWFDEEAADWIFDFFEEVLTLKEGRFEGLPFILDEHQKFIVGSLFGWKKPLNDDDPNDRKTWRRRFRRFYWEEAKGGGKTPILGGIGLYLTAFDGEAGAQVFAVAAKREQAGLCFDDAVSMYFRSDLMQGRFEKQGNRTVTKLYDPDSRSFFKPMSKDTGKTGSGWRPSAVLADEVHEHPDRTIVETMERGFKSRRQPLVVMATNSGTDRNSYCYEEHTHGKNVATGMVDDDTTFSYISALDEGDDPFEDESCWIKANPMLGKIMSHDDLRLIVDQGKKVAGKRNDILRKHFCVWTDADTAWLQSEAWMALEDGSLREEDFHGKKVWMGLDLSSTMDMTARANLYEDGEDEKGRPCYALFVKCYMPEDTIYKREKEDKAPYTVWVDEGWLTLTEGAQIRYEHVARDLLEDISNAVLQIMAYDRYMYKRFDEALQDESVLLPLTDHPQGFNRRKDTTLCMNDSIDMLETAILEGRIRVQPNPVIRSAVAGSTFRSSETGQRMFSKVKATTRIDAIVATAMAMGATESETVNSLLNYYKQGGSAKVIGLG